MRRGKGESENVTLVVFFGKRRLGGGEGCIGGIRRECVLRVPGVEKKLSFESGAWRILLPPWRRIEERSGMRMIWPMLREKEKISRDSDCYY